MLLTKVKNFNVGTFRDIWPSLERWQCSMLNGWILHLSKFVWTLRSSVWVVFNNFFLIDATDKISSDQKRVFIALSLYPLSLFANTPFKVRFHFGFWGFNLGFYNVFSSKIEKKFSEKSYCSVLLAFNCNFAKESKKYIFPTYPTKM